MRILDLGALEVDSGARTERISGAKQVAILSLLCLRRGSRVSIGELIVAGWGEDARVTDATIENHIWRLRRTIEPDRPAQTCLINDAGGYRLDLPAEAVDSAWFEQLADRARDAVRRTAYAEELRWCDEALALWRGSPFDILSSAIATDGAIARLHELHAQLREWRVDAQLATGETERAALDLELFTAEDPFRERLWVQWMTALSRLGRNEEALRVYQRVRTLLRDELGLEPGPELRELQRAIIMQDEDLVSAPGLSSTDTASAMAAPTAILTTESMVIAAARPQWVVPAWPLVGFRAQALQLASVLESGVSGAVIRGPAGVGKSRFLDEALALARRSGAHVLRIVATRSTSSVPLGAFAGVLPETVRSDDLFTLLHRSASALREAGEGRPLVVGVDDAHLLDDPSAALVLHLATSGGARVFVTMRSREPAPDAIRSLDKDAGAARIELGALDRGDTGSLVDEILGAPVDPAVHRWVYRIGRGNAMYTTELIRSARTEGSLIVDDGRWRLASVPQVPGSLTEIVDSTLSRLDGLQRHALEVLALGEPVRLDDLVRLVGMDAVVGIESAALVDVGGIADEARVTVSHPLYSAVVRAGLPTLRARLVLTELIEASRHRDDLTASERLRRTRWRIEVGDDPGVEALVEAARTALGSADPDLASELAQRAAGEGAVVDARLISAKASILRHEYAIAGEQLRDLEPDLRLPAQAIAYLELQSEVLHWGQSRPADLRDMLDRADQWWSTVEWRAELLPLRRRLEVFGRLLPAPEANDPDVDASGTAVPGPDGIGHRAVASDEAPGERSALIGGLFYSGKTAAALAVIDTTRIRLPVVDLDEAIILSLGARIRLESGSDWSELDRRLARQLSDGLDVGDPASAGQAAYSLAELRLLQSRVPESSGLLDIAEAQLQQRDPVALLPVVAAAQVITSHFLGDEVAMDAALRRCRERTGPQPLAHQLPYTARAEAWAEFHYGDRGAGQQRLLDAATELAGSPVHLARLTYEAMRLGAAPTNVAPVLEDTSDRCDAGLVMLYAAHARARADDDAAALAAVSGELSKIGAVLYSSEAAEDEREASARAGRA